MTQILRTYREVFPYTIIYSARGALTLLGSRHEIKPDVNVSFSRFKEINEVYKKYDLKTVYSALLGQIYTPAMFDGVIYDQKEVNSIFAPTLEYRAGRAYFASQHVDLQTLTMQKMPLPLPDSVAGQAFVYEPFLDQISDESILETIKKLSLTSPITVVALKKVLATRSVKSRTELQKIDPSNEFAFLLGLTDSLSKPNLEAKIEQRLANMLGQFRQLVMIGESPRLGRLAAEIEKSCDSVKENFNKDITQVDLTSISQDCLKSLYTAGIFLSGPKVVEKLTLLPLNIKNSNSVKEVVSAWLEIKATYKKIGAF